MTETFKASNGWCIDAGGRCSESCCDRPVHARGLCHSHYEQVRRGEQLRPIRPKRRQGGDFAEGFWASVDMESEACWGWQRALSEGYGKVWTNSGLEFAHRVAYELERGPIPDGMELDHMCRNRACVNPSHLRIVTRGQNAENRGKPKNNTSGYRGVTLVKKTGRWKAYARHDGVEHTAGYFDTPEEANEAAIRLRSELFTHNIESFHDAGELVRLAPVESEGE